MKMVLKATLFIVLPLLLANPSAGETFKIQVHPEDVTADAKPVHKTWTFMSSEVKF